MGVSCRIFLKRPRFGVRRVGEPMIGFLRYVIDKPTEYQTATFSLVGEAKCKWKEHLGKGTHTYTGNETFLSLHLNILDNRPDETATLPVGKYEFPFQFTLPLEIPPSFKDKYSEIQYHLVVTFEKPRFFHSTKMFKKQITVYGDVNPMVIIEPVTYRERKKLFTMFSCKEHIVKLQARIIKSFLMPGENAELQILVTNNTKTEIPCVKAELINQAAYYSPGFFSTDTKFEEKTFDQCSVTFVPLPKSEVSRFTLLVPTLPGLHSLQHCKIIQNEYLIRVTVCLRFPHRNFSLNVPVAFGEGRCGDFSGTVELNNSDEGSDLPPSYWEVMNENKSEEVHDEKK